jgi:hypothetical protein
MDMASAQYPKHAEVLEDIAVSFLQQRYSDEDGEEVG